MEEKEQLDDILRSFYIHGEADSGMGSMLRTYVLFLEHKWDT